MQVVVVLLSVVAVATCSIPMAATHTEPVKTPEENCLPINGNSSTALMFTSVYENPITVFLQRYIFINCSAQHFCSIWWFKDGMPYPFGLEDKKHIIALGGHNQTLEIKTAYEKQEGNYTCIAMDGTGDINRTMELLVKDHPFEDTPQPLNDPNCTDKEAGVGSTAEFFCHFYAGDKIYSVNVTWYKKLNGMDYAPVGSLDSTKTEYEEVVDYTHLSTDSVGRPTPTVGKYLYIKDVTTEAYGYYRLVANSTELGTGTTHDLRLSEPPPPLKPSLTGVIAASVTFAALLVVVVSLAVTWHFVKLDFKIWHKNRFAALEDDDGKIYDAFICYADENLQFVLEIRQELIRVGYRVCVREINFDVGAAEVEEMIAALKASHRCLIIITPELLTARHTNLQVDVSTEVMMQKQIKIIPILYRAITKEEREGMPLLNRILSNVPSVRWDDGNTEKAVKRLLVHMPPRRPQLSDEDPAEDTDNWQHLI